MRLYKIETLLFSIGVSCVALAQSNSFEFKNYKKTSFGCHAEISLTTDTLDYLPIPKVMISDVQDQKVWLPHSCSKVIRLENQKYEIRVSDDLIFEIAKDCESIQDRRVVVQY